MRRLKALVFSVLFVGLVAPLQAGTKVKLPDGRSYEIALPAGKKNAPLILALHGGGGSGAWMAKVSGMTGVANANGFAIAYPDGSGRGRFLTWNAGYCCAYAAKKRTDDIAFLSRVIDDAVARFGIDKRNVFITGMSNGGMMSERLGAMRPDLVRAVASVSGSFDVKKTPISGAIPLLHIHGTADNVVPYEGGHGKGQLKGERFPPVEDIVNAWARAQNSKLKSTQTIINPAKRDKTQVVKTTYSAGGKPRVVFFRVEGGSHSWPGSPRGGRKGVSKDINASNEIVKFFKTHLR